MAERIIIKGSFIWDGTGKNLLPEQAVIIEGKRIVAFDKFSEINSSPYNKLLDFTGLTLMPGMIDCHTHHSLDASLENFLDRMADETSELTSRATGLMKKDLSSGVTMCRTMGDKEYLDIFCRDSVNEGLAVGPRSIVAGKGIRAGKGHGFVGYPFNGVEEIRNAIKENLHGRS